VDSIGTESEHRDGEYHHNSGHSYSFRSAALKPADLVPEVTDLLV
jgi:hypothetical protein